MLGISCLYSHGYLQPSDIPDYHIENSRLSKYFEMQWFLQRRVSMRFICSTSFSSVCDRNEIRWKHLAIGMHAILFILCMCSALFCHHSLVHAIPALKIPSSCPSTPLNLKYPSRFFFFEAFPEIYRQIPFFLNSYICNTLLSYLENRVLLFLIFIGSKVLCICRSLPHWQVFHCSLYLCRPCNFAFPLWAGWPAHSFTLTSCRWLALIMSRGLNQHCTLGIPCCTASITMRTVPC